VADDADDPFAHLSETLTGDPDAREGRANEERTGENGDGSDPSGPSGSTDGDGTRPTDPAFAYEEAVQRPFYAREATVEAFDAWLNYELERDLSERGYRNVVVREMTDALLRTVVEEDLVDEVAERFARARDAESNPGE
jgi:hypothetical protein